MINLKASGFVPTATMQIVPRSGYNEHTASYTPYELGLQAHRQGAKMDENPFWVTSDAWDEWCIAHMEAERLATDTTVLG